VSSITLPAILKWIPAVAAIGVPLSYLWGHAYAVGYASYFGISGDFVKVGPEAAVKPFLLFLALLTLGFMVIHELQKYGVSGVLKIYGSVIRPVVFFGVLGFWVVTVSRGEGSPTRVLLATFMLWVLLWWLPPFIAWGTRQTVRGLGFVLRPVGRKIYRPAYALLRHLFRNVEEHGSPRDSRALWKFLLLIGFCSAALVAPQGFGLLQARGQVEFPVVNDGSSLAEKQAILAVYGEKVFLARVQGTIIRAVIVKQADDLKDVEIRSERLGELKLAK
jgi:hypothetical protein